VPVLNAGVEPYTTIYAEGEGELGALYRFLAPFFALKPAANNRLQSFSLNSYRFRPATAKTWLLGGFC